ncbi:LysR family transcriptional regulator [Agrobacterium sp. Ap1]|uniref:LysR family transcriptional regulator n=1 Tax=Agrobacterium sp. Ap1 TaxID=2815337 RepID=UPI001A8C6C6C|nr:LysR family transcriptional regulator [Agrobacterium sp. Ap1]MBO0145190.1 LysR family transcriptional regulator [Agrobacterium sp. Ap1]
MIPDYLETRQLEAFVAVVSIGSMTGAAKALGKSQPVVTRLIQDLEKELGFTVLHRNGPRIAPTEQGITFFAQAELFLSGLRTISERARSIRAATPRPIEIASIPALSASLLPLALSNLAPELFPQHIHLQSTSAENVVQAVVARSADVGMASLPLDNPGVDVHWIGEAPCVAVVADSDPLAAKSVIAAEDLLARRLIMSANPFRLRMRIDEALQSHGITPAAIIDSNATYVSLALARAGVGVALVESATIAGLPIVGVRVIPLAFRVPFYWGVITASGRPMAQAIGGLIDAIEKSARVIPGFVKHEPATIPN